MADFKIAFPLIISNLTGKTGDEGVYSNEKNDPGGATVYGLTIPDDPSWNQWPKLKNIIAAGEDNNAISASIIADPSIYESAMNFYYAKYWVPLNLNLIDEQNLANSLFNIAVNEGPGTAGTFFQRVLNAFSHNGVSYPRLPLSGNIHDQTIAAYKANKHHNFLLIGIACLQGAKYITLDEANPALSDFENSWFDRIILS